MDPDEHPANAGVASKTRRGIAWNIVGAVLTNGMRLVSVVVLGRILSPHDFGVVAAALSVMLVLHQFRDVGIGSALIQRENLERGHVATAFAFSFLLGLVLAGLLVVTASWIGALYDIPESVEIVRALGALFVLRGISTVPLMLCRRAMNFRAIALVDATTYAVGSGCAMILAVAGAGPWSLVIGYIVEEALAAACYMSLQRPPITLRIERVRLRDLLGFGIGHTIIQLANILAVQGDKFVVGRTLGAVELGFYTRAYELIKLPAAIFNNVVGNVLFPAFSRVQNDRERLAAGFRRATLANGLVLFPASAVLLVTAPEAIRVVMGGQWDAAVVPFQILALSMMMRTSYKVGVAIASAAGKVYAVAISSVAHMLVVLVGAAISIRWGITGVAVTTTIAITVNYVLCCWVAAQVTALPPATVIRAHIPGLAIAGFVAVACWFLVEQFRATEMPVPVSFAAVACIGVLLTLAGAVAWLRFDSDDARWLRSEIARVVAKLTGRKS